ncbi:MAG: YbaY family lipoprotein [Dokdonella sp.]
MIKSVATVLVAIVALGGCKSSDPAAVPGSTGQAATPAQNSAPAQSAPVGTAVTGVVALREPMVIGEGSRLEIKLVDVAMTDIVVAETSTAVSGQPPYNFTLEFDPAKIDRTRTYVINALLFDGDRRFIPALQSPVLTGGSGNTVEVVLNAEATPGEEAKEEFNRLKAQIGGMRRVQDAFLDGDLSVAWDGFVDASGKVRFMRVNSETGEGETAQRSNVEYAYLDDKPMALLKKNSGNTRVGWDAEGNVILRERAGGTVSDDEAKAFYSAAEKALSMGQAKAPKK